MANYSLRNIDAAVMQKLKEDAKRRGMSCNKYLVGILTNYALASEIKELDSRYQELFKIVIDTIEGNSMLLREILINLKGAKEINDTEVTSS